MKNILDFYQGGAGLHFWKLPLDRPGRDIRAKNREFERGDYPRQVTENLQGLKLIRNMRSL